MTKMNKWPEEAKYVPADAEDELAQIGADIIEHDDAHAHLRGANILYIYRKKATIRHGKAVWGKARMFNEFVRTAMLALAEKEYVFAIVIAWDIWHGEAENGEDGLDEEQKRCLVDHELSHCGMEDDVPALLDHDVGEFYPVMAKHGLEACGLEKLREMQGTLFARPEQIEQVKGGGSKVEGEAIIKTAAKEVVDAVKAFLATEDGLPYRVMLRHPQALAEAIQTIIETGKDFTPASIEEGLAVWHARTSRQLRKKFKGLMAKMDKARAGKEAQIAAAAESG